MLRSGYVAYNAFMKNVQDEVRKLTVTGRGTTYYLTIPQKMVRALKWKKGEKKVVRLGKDSIVITDWKKEIPGS